MVSQSTYSGVFTEEPISAIKPKGWIKRWLEIQKQGLTGHLEAAGFPFDTKLWACREIPFTHGAPWWPYEQTAYWVDGFARTGYLLRDFELTQKAYKQVEYVLKHADKDGYLGPKSCKAPMPAGRWSHQIFFRAMIAHFYVTGDKRIVPALQKHYLSSRFDHSGHRDVCNVEIMCWVYGQTGNKKILDLAEKTWIKFLDEAADQDLHLREEMVKKNKPADTHGVTYLETVKQGAILYLYTGKNKYREYSRLGLRKLDRFHMLVDGAPSSTESLRGTTSLDAHETCDVADYIWTAGFMVMADGDASYADKMERCAYNAFPGAVTKDFRQLQYFSSPNQTVLAENSGHTLAAAGGKWMCYRPKPGTECCTGEVNRVMPGFVSRMWMSRKADPAAVLYGPSEHTFRRGGAEIRISEETCYPFDEEIDFSIETARPVKFTLWLRIPGWCRKAFFTVNGKRYNRKLKAGTFVPVTRTFRQNDRIRLYLPMELKLTPSVDGGVSVERGPLLYALPIQEKRTIDRKDRFQTKEFPAYSMHPDEKWNYTLAVDEQNLDKVKVEYDRMTLEPWSAPPIKLKVPMKTVKGWKLRTPKVIDSVGGKLIDPERNLWQTFRTKKKGNFLLTPLMPDPKTLKKKLSKTVTEKTLVPYGCTLLRVAVFPKGKG